MSETAAASMADPGPEPARLGDQLPSLKDLQTTEQMELLDSVDQLRAHGLNEITALPQLIVCGDQSSGKSSVLEAISGVPFPRKDNVCTRFATELILRRAPSESMSVSITPGQDRKGPERERIAEFQHRLTSKEGFPLLFEQAKEVMGLGEGGKSFSKDILRVEIYGPLQPQLTLVDLPGFIHAAIKGQTDNDIVLVNDLIASYLENPRSIILAVVSAKSDISNQIILTKARKVDPEGKRTLGIITKPDLLATNSDSEKAYIALARNDDVVFSLGWHVVRNIDLMREKAQEQTRDQLEASFFRSSNFNSLPSKSVGIAPLRSRLSRVLFNQIRNELPRLLEEIEAKIKKVEATRDQLGHGRQEPFEKREFLINTSQRFLVICENAVKGYYDHAFFHCGTEPERRLCANLMNQHFEFAEILRGKGAYYKVIDKKVHSSDEDHGSSKDAIKPDEEYVDDLFEEVRKRTRDEAIELACEKLKLSRGRELPGLPNPFLVGELFREYSQPWEGLAREHIKDVWDATNRFLELALEYLVGSDVADKILGLWLYPIMEQKLAAANAKLDELLEVHKDEPMTTNHYFVDTRKKLQHRNFKDDLKGILESKLTKPNQKISSDDIPQIMSMITPEVNLDMDMVAAEDAFDNMNAYYKVAMKLFMDNVPTLAIQGPIVRQVPAMFRPSDVNRMSAELVEKIAAESEEKSRLREETLTALVKLEEGARICKQNIPRSRQYRTNHATDLRQSNNSARSTEGSRETLYSKKGITVPEGWQSLSTPARPQSRTPSPRFANAPKAVNFDPPQTNTPKSSETSTNTNSFGGFSSTPFGSTQPPLLSSSSNLFGGSSSTPFGSTQPPPLSSSTGTFGGFDRKLLENYTPPPSTSGPFSYVDSSSRGPFSSTGPFGSPGTFGNPKSTSSNLGTTSAMPESSVKATSSSFFPKSTGEKEESPLGKSTPKSTGKHRIKIKLPPTPSTSEGTD